MNDMTGYITPSMFKQGIVYEHIDVLDYGTANDPEWHTAGAERHIQVVMNKILVHHRIFFNSTGIAPSKEVAMRRTFCVAEMKLTETFLIYGLFDKRPVDFLRVKDLSKWSVLLSGNNTLFDGKIEFDLSFLDSKEERSLTNRMVRIDQITEEIGKQTHGRKKQFSYSVYPRT